MAGIYRLQGFVVQVLAESVFDPHGEGRIVAHVLEADGVGQRFFVERIVTVGRIGAEGQDLLIIGVVGAAQYGVEAHGVRLEGLRLIAGLCGADQFDRIAHELLAGQLQFDGVVVEFTGPQRIEGQGDGRIGP